MLAKGGRVYREFVFCAWMSWERVLPLFGVNKSIDNLQMSDKGLVKHSWLCIWALQCLPRGLCFCKPLHTPPELRRLREDLVYLSLSTAVCWPSPYSATLWCVCVLTCRILLPLSPECRSQAGATLLDLCRPFLFQVSSSSIWILLSLCLSSACCSPRARPFSLSVWGNSLHSHHHSIWELWLLGCAFQTPAFSYW